MAKLVLSDVSNPQNETTFVSTINNNSASIEAAIENTLSRDGTSPNAMESDLDMNSNRILNLPLAASDTEPVRKGEFDVVLEGLEDLEGAVAEAEAAAGQAQAAQANAEAAVVDAEAAAAEAAANAQEVLDEFETIYLGSFASDPTLDNEGNPLVEGALYWNSSTNALKIYDGAAWQAYTAATGLLEVADDTSPTLGGNLDVGAFTVGDAAAADLTKLSELTATSTELNYVDGVTSAIQTQIDSKLSTATAASTYQPLDADLTALAGNSTDGLWAHTGAGTGSARTITGTTDQITVTNGNGVSGNPTLSLPATARAAEIVFIIDGYGSVLTTGVKGYLRIPFACTITGVRMLADQSGSAVVDIWKDTYANYPPVNADSITASANPTISAATKSEDTTLTGWTTSIAAGDILGYNVDSCSSITRLTVTLSVTKA